MSSITSVSGSSFASFASGVQSGQSSLPTTAPGASLTGIPAESSQMFASFEAAVQSGDPMRMLVAMLVMNLLLGNEEEQGQTKRDELMAGLVGLAMLGQGGASGAAGVSMSYSSSVTLAQQSAQGAYAQSVTATSSFSMLG